MIWSTFALDSFHTRCPSAASAVRGSSVATPNVPAAPINKMVRRLIRRDGAVPIEAWSQSRLRSGLRFVVIFIVPVAHRRALSPVCIVRRTADGFQFPQADELPVLTSPIVASTGILRSDTGYRNATSRLIMLALGLRVTASACGNRALRYG
jgi:hypothetical protein